MTRKKPSQQRRRPLGSVVETRTGKHQARVTITKEGKRTTVSRTFDDKAAAHEWVKEAEELRRAGKEVTARKTGEAANAVATLVQKLAPSYDDEWVKKTFGDMEKTIQQLQRRFAMLEQYLFQQAAANDRADQFPDLDSDSIRAVSSGSHSTERAWVREQLADGVRLKTDDLKARARRDGMEWHRVKRAAEDEGVSKERVATFPSYTEWSLPLAHNYVGDRAA
jgi:uncharacterized Ntn-hydrolase superfamily protein